MSWHLILISQPTITADRLSTVSPSPIPRSEECSQELLCHIVMGNNLALVPDLRVKTACGAEAPHLPSFELLVGQHNLICFPEISGGVAKSHISLRAGACKLLIAQAFHVTLD